MLFARHASRGAELGADIVKITIPAVQIRSEVVRGRPVPVVIAGGPKADTQKKYSGWFTAQFRVEVLSIP
jgi:fructose-bisphosphate aldolase/2-amino-3,7-dideoxy-D-threo-hept-6-ulosonate synthase